MVVEGIGTITNRVVKGLREAEAGGTQTGHDPPDSRPSAVPIHGDGES